jgi:flagellar biosynthetic protein FliP
MTSRAAIYLAISVAIALGACAPVCSAQEGANQPARLESATAGDAFAPVDVPAAQAAPSATREERVSQQIAPTENTPLPAAPASDPSAPPDPAADSAANTTAQSIADTWLKPDGWASPEQLGSSVQMLLLLSMLSLAPAVLVMTTSFVRSVVVLGLLRQAIGTQQLPPNQVMTALALFLTLAVMGPTWKQVYNEAIAPYSEHEIDLDTAWQRGVAPVRRFMSMQIERTGNTDDVFLFLDHMPHVATPTDYDEVPLEALVPAFMLSELKTAFLIGFRVYLPFVILDLVISSVLMSMGMMMLPPVMISLPFKLMLFVLVDGWHLVVGMLLESFAVVV